MTERIQRRKPRRSKFSTAAKLLFVALLPFPALAILRLARFIEPRIIVGYLILISGVTVWLYWHDKRRAEEDGWRTPESTLHLVELLGGWPAAFIAQRAFRHKTSKVRFQLTFWAIVASYQMASIDFLAEWQYTRAVIQLLLPFLRMDIEKTG